LCEDACQETLLQIRAHAGSFTPPPRPKRLKRPRSGLCASLTEPRWGCCAYGSGGLKTKSRRDWRSGRNCPRRPIRS
jgi:hypothetical protein